MRQKRELPYDQTRQPKVWPPQESKSAHRKNCMATFTAAVHTSQEMDQRRRPSAEKAQHTGTIVFSYKERRWMEPHIITLSVISQTQKDYCVLLSHIHVRPYVGVCMYVCTCVGHETRKGTMERERVME